MAWLTSRLNDLDADGAASLLLCALVAVVSTVLVLAGAGLARALWRRSRRGASDAAVGSRRNSLSPAEQRAVERDMTNLMHELADMARDVGRQVDARSARLEHLLRAADERISRLEQLERATKQRIAPAPPPPPPSAPAPPAPRFGSGNGAVASPAPAPPRPARLAPIAPIDPPASVPQLEHAAQAAVSSESDGEDHRDDDHFVVPARPAAVATPVTSSGRPDDPRHATIYALADEGFTAPEIAQRLGRPSGEIELILALRPRQKR